MQATAEKPQRIPSSGRKKDEHKPNPQRKAGGRTGVAYRNEQPEPGKPVKGIPTREYTIGFNPNRVVFEPKMGYQILSQYGVPVDFSQGEKIRAVMLYNCIKHLPGFVDRKFDNVRDAVCYVYDSTKKLIHQEYEFITNSYRSDIDDKVPDEYMLQIVYDTFSIDCGRWQSYDYLDKCPDRSLKRAMFMCMHIMIHKFGFSLFDCQGSDSVMAFDEWADMEMEQHLDEESTLLAKFHEVNQRDFSHSVDDYETDIGQDITDVEVHLNKLEEMRDIHVKKTIPVQKKITKAKVSVPFIMKQIDRYKCTDVSDWMNHIVTYYNDGFRICDYIADSYRFSSIDGYDEESISPRSCYGYIYDGDDEYTDHINNYYNEYAGNYSIIPFAINKVIHPKDGEIFCTKNIGLGGWLNRVFSFSFQHLKYET